MFDPSRNQNHFQLFALPVSFTLDSEVLAERYRLLRQTVHPDLYATASDRETRLTLQASTLVNEAYQTLRDPLTRARHLLEVRGGGLGDDQETTQDMAFLMEQMELREALAAARQAPEPHAAIERVRARLESLADDLIAEMGARLDRGAPDIGATPAPPSVHEPGTGLGHGAPEVGAPLGQAPDRAPDPSPGLARGLPLDGAQAAAIRELIRKLQFVRKCEAEAEDLEAELDEAL